MNNTCVVDGVVYKLVHQNNSDKCVGCIGDYRITGICRELGDCNIGDGKNYIWLEESQPEPNNKAYDICMAEHYKYMQYDLVKMDDFERGCIVGRKLQSEKLARMIKNATL